MRTSFHHQPEAQHPKFFSYQQAAGRLPHLLEAQRTLDGTESVAIDPTAILATEVQPLPKRYDKA
jgi:hypothetical protein